MHKGFLRLWREFQSNELWREPRVFSKAEAWIDILLTVRYSKEPEKVQIGLKNLICYRGESLKSIETWAMRWQWSKSKVVRFFGMLKNRNAIETHNETVTTRLIVCNYNAYNKQRNGNETQAERKPKRKRNACETQTETEEEGKESKKVKKEVVATPPPPKTMKGKDTWLTPFMDIWIKHYGGILPIDKSVTALKKIIGIYGPEKTILGFEGYCSHTPAQYASAPNYATIAGSYINHPPPKKPFVRGGV